MSPPDRHATQVSHHATAGEHSGGCIRTVSWPATQGQIALIQKSKSLEKANFDLVKLLAVRTVDCDELVKQNRDLITDKKSEPQRGSARSDQQATDQRTLVIRVDVDELYTPIMPKLSKKSNPEMYIVTKIP